MKPEPPSEKPIGLKEVRFLRFFHPRIRPSRQAPWRWCNKGVRGIRLEHSRIGGRIVTSEAAVLRFLLAVVDDADGEMGVPLNPDCPLPTLGGMALNNNSL